MMKAGIAILLLCYAVEVVSSFQLYESMQETRNAIMSFYDPDDVKADDEPLESEINWHKETSIHEIAEPEFSEDEKDDFKALPRDHKFSVLEKPWERPKIGKGPKVAEERTTGVSSLGFRQPVPLPTAPRARPTLKSLPKPISTRVTKKSKPVTSKKRVSLNKFSEALEDIEKALADAQVVRRVNHNEQRLRRLRDLIKTAVEKRSYRFARKAIGEAMYTIKKINEQR